MEAAPPSGDLPLTNPRERGTMRKSAWERMQEMKEAGTLPAPSPRRHATLTHWWAVGYSSLPGCPIPAHNKRHVDRWCIYIADHDTDVRELAEEEIAKHDPCLVCSG